MAMAILELEISQPEKWLWRRSRDGDCVKKAKSSQQFKTGKSSMLGSIQQIKTDWEVTNAGKQSAN